MDTPDTTEDLGGKIKEAMVNNIINGDRVLNGIDSVICNHFGKVIKWDTKIKRGSIFIHMELGYDHPLKETFTFKIIE
jgi:hypothetical protein